ncbi:hypothetical protein [Ferrimicrobium sp.]|jgi:hypothetical protein|uniref:hypothetical protein n=2 Tax=Ferrimicrobium sp. TaxID=2926050 RepID=UPI0027E440F7|nr:hypothetical protein [Ferrimicrobium sp.]
MEGAFDSMRRIILPATAVVALPLLLSACGSTSAIISTAHLSPQAAVDAAYRVAGASPTSFHLNETVNITVNKKGYGGSTISGDVYSDPSHTSGSYASLTENLSVLGKSEGSLLTLVKNNNVYINAGGIHLSGVSVTPGWKVMSLSNYFSELNSASSSSVSPTITTSAQSSLLPALINDAKISASGSSTVGGQAVNVYTASISYPKLIKALSTSNGVLATALSKTLSLYQMTGTATVTIDIAKSNNRVASVAAVFASTFAPVKGSPTKYHFDLAVQQQYSNYGVKFTVKTPASAKTVTSFKGL